MRRRSACRQIGSDRIGSDRIAEAFRIGCEKALGEVTDTIRQCFERQGHGRIRVENFTPAHHQFGGRRKRGFEVFEPARDSLVGVHSGAASSRRAASRRLLREATEIAVTGTPIEHLHVHLELCDIEESGLVGRSHQKVEIAIRVLVTSGPLIHRRAHP